jgi:uncharacterized protein YqiB (DUF1249 family)
MSTVLAEHNYARVMDLIPALRAMPRAARSRVRGAQDLHLQVLEQCAYSTVFVLVQYSRYARAWRPNPEVKVRVYHDLRVAEVLSYRNPFGERHAYPCSPEQPFQPDAKRELNFFLWKWLGHCLAAGHRLHGQPERVGP